MKVNVVAPAFPSACETLAIENEGVGESSFWMFAWPWVSLIPAFTPFVRFTAKDSRFSSVVSPFTFTVRGALEVPAGIVRTPDAAT